MTAAGVLARAGHAVTLFERTERLGGKAQGFEQEGIKLDSGPTLLTLPRTVRETFAALAAEDLLPRLFELPEACAYHYPDGARFIAHRNLDALAAEARAFGPREADAMRDFYQKAEEIYAAAGAPYLEAPFERMTGFMARVAARGLRAISTGMQLRTLAELAASHFTSEHLRQYVNRFATYVGASPYQASAAFALIPHLERAEGVHHPEGGMNALVGAMEAAIRRLGVKVVLSARAELEMRERHPHVGPRGDAAPFDAVVVNADPLAFERKYDAPLALSGYVACFELPPGASLPHHAVLFAPNYRREFETLFSGKVPEEPTLYLCHPASTDPGMASPDGRSGLFVMANAPPLPRWKGESEAAELDRARTFWEREGRTLREHVRSRLATSLPALRGPLRLLRERTPVDFLLQGAPGGSLYGMVPHGKLGPFRRPKIKADVPGVFYAGGGTHPGGGVPMVMLSGRFAAQLALQHLGGPA